MDINPILLEPRDYPMVALARLKEQRLSEGKPVYDFGTGDPTIPVVPFLAEALKAAVPEIPQYPTVKGSPELIEAITGYIERECGRRLEADAVIPTAGSKEAIYHFYPMVLHPAATRRGVIYPDPGYPVYSGGTRFHGGTCHPQVTGPATGFQIDLAEVPNDQLADSCVAWVCNPHNPTGAVGDVDWLRRQIEVARTHDLILCVDECYFEIHDGDRPPTVLAEDDLTGILAFHSLSKRSGFTAFRSGFIAGDPQLVAHLRKMRPNFGVASQVFIQAMAAAAWNDVEHARERRETFNDRRRRACAFLDRNGFSYSGREATFYLWVETPGGIDDEAYCRTLFEEGGIIASPGSFFGEGGRGHFRLALVPTDSETEDAFAVWQALIDDGRLPSAV